MAVVVAARSEIVCQKYPQELDALYPLRFAHALHKSTIISLYLTVVSARLWVLRQGVSCSTLHSVCRTITDETYHCGAISKMYDLVVVKCGIAVMS